MKFQSALLEHKGYSLLKPLEAMRALEEQGVKVIDLTLGDPRLPAAPVARAALAKSIEENSYFNYPPARGTENLRETFCAWAKKEYGTTLDPSRHCLSSNGSKEAIFSLPLLFDWTDEACICAPTPAYPVYRDSASFLGIDFEEIRLDWDSGYLPQLERISDEVFQRCRLFWINYPHNPTGAGAPRALFEELLEKAERFDFLLASDECYHDMFFDDRPSSLLEFEDSQHWVVLRSLSKRSHMTGFRSGMICSLNEEIISLLAKLRAPMGVSTPTFIQEAAASAWGDSQHVEEERKQYVDRREKLRMAMEAAGFEVFPSTAGFYLWCRHHRGLTSERCYQLFLENGIIITRGSAFDPPDSLSIRLVYCLETELIEEVCERIRTIRFE